MYALEQGLDGSEVAQANFPLPQLSKKIEAICRDVYDGRGFGILRGLEPDLWSVEDITVIYLGISSYVAEKRGKQDQRGSTLSKRNHDYNRIETLSNFCQCMSSSCMTRETSNTVSRRQVHTEATSYPS